MIVDISKISVKKIRELIVFTAFLVVALWKFDVVLDVLKAIWGIAFPFVLGGAIAFVTNVPMSFLEKKIFGRVKKENKIVVKLARPISLLLTIILAVHSFQTLTCKKICKCPISQRTDFKKSICLLFWKKSEKYFSDLHVQLLLLKKNIAGK